MGIALKGSIIFARDMRKMADFYRDVVGLTYAESPHSDDEWITFVDGGNTFALHSAAPHQQAAISDPSPVRWSTPIKVVFKVDDLQAKCDQLVARGLKSTWGNIEDGLVDFADPEGNMFQLTNL